VETAAHCCTLSAPFELFCPGGVHAKSKIDAAAVPKEVQTSLLENDICLVSFEDDLGIEPIRLPASKEEFQTLLSKEGNCALFGYGSDGIHRGAIAEFARQTTWGGPWWDHNMIVHQKPGVLKPGDSGGGVYCKDSKEKWVLMASNSNDLGSYYSDISVSILPHLDWIRPLLDSKPTSEVNKNRVLASEVSRLCENVETCLNSISPSLLFLNRDVTGVLTAIQAQLNQGSDQVKSISKQSQSGEEGQKRDDLAELNLRISTLRNSYQAALEKCEKLRTVPAYERFLKAITVR
jgi:hypothetical protein